MKKNSFWSNEIWYPMIIEIDPQLFANEILTFQCRYSYCCWDDWLMLVCGDAIGHARTWAQLYMAAWICPLGGPFFSACDSDRARSPPDSRIPPEANPVTSWSIAATQNTPTPIRMKSHDTILHEKDDLEVSKVGIQVPYLKLVLSTVLRC